MKCYRAQTEGIFGEKVAILVSADSLEQARALAFASPFRESVENLDDFELAEYPDGDVYAAADGEACAWDWNREMFQRRYYEMDWALEDASCCGDCGRYEFDLVPESTLDDEYHEVCRECLAERSEKEAVAYRITSETNVLLREEASRLTAERDAAVARAEEANTKLAEISTKLVDAEKRATETNAMAALSHTANQAAAAEAAGLRAAVGFLIGSMEATMSAVQHRRPDGVYTDLQVYGQYVESIRTALAALAERDAELLGACRAVCESQDHGGCSIYVDPEGRPYHSRHCEDVTALRAIIGEVSS